MRSFAARGLLPGSWRLVAGILLATLLTDVSRAGSCCPPALVARHEWPVAGGLWSRGDWIAVDGLGGVYLGWHDATTAASQSFLAVSHDDGASFDVGRLPIGGALPDNAVQGAVDAQGHLLLAWKEAGQIMVSTSADQGRTIAPARAIATTTAPIGVKLFLTSSGVALLLWQDRIAPGTVRLSGATSADMGSSWLPEQVIATLSDWAALKPAISSGDAIVMGWLDPGVGGDVHVRRSVDGGASWEPPIQLQHDVRANMNLELGSTGEGWVQALFGMADNQWHVHVSCNDGATWTRRSAGFGIVDWGHLLCQPGGQVAVISGSSPPNRHYFNRSDRQGLPGTWLGTSRTIPCNACDHLHDAVVPRAGLVYYATEAQESIAGCTDVFSCTSIYLDSTCDEGATWLSRRIRLDRDEPGWGTDSWYPLMAVAPSGRVHVSWIDDGRTTLNSRFCHVALDPVAPSPALLVTVENPGDPEPRRRRLDVDASALAGCASLTYQWYRDGMVLPGETGAEHVLPDGASPGTHYWHCVVGCASPAGCARPSEVFSLEVAPPPPVADQEIEGLLFVSKSGGGIALSWTDALAGTMAWGTYSGTIQHLWAARSYDHVPLVCHVNREPPGAPEGNLTIDIPPRNSYFLVTPADCRSEGSAGWSTRGDPHVSDVPDAACGPAPPF